MREMALRTLMYHRVLDDRAAQTANPSLVSALPAVFEQQMRHLARRYRVMSAHDVRAAVRLGRRLPDRAVLITFDDAYSDFGEIAWPILRRYGLSATVFVASDYPSHPERSFWWDRLYQAVERTRTPSIAAGPFRTLRLDSAEARRNSLRVVQQGLKRLPHADAMRVVDEVCAALGADSEPGPRVLTWPELRALAADGVVIGGHTRSHPALDRLPPELIDAEVRGCRADIARELGAEPFAFAYPFGAYNAIAVATVRRAGFELGFTCNDGHSALGTADPMQLHRTNITPRTSGLLFRFRLLPAGAYVDRWRNGRTSKLRPHASVT